MQLPWPIAEAVQRKTLADAEYYASQKRAEAEAYQITKTAAAQQQAVRALLAELKDKGDLAEHYIQFMIAQELKENRKWIISGDSTPIVNVQGSLLRGND